MTEHSLWRFSRALHRAINERQPADLEAPDLRQHVERVGRIGVVQGECRLDHRDLAAQRVFF